MSEWRSLTGPEIVDLATRLESLAWSWQMDDVSDLAAHFGWTVLRAKADWVMLDVGFGMASGSILGRDGRADTIELAVTDNTDGEARSGVLLRDTFAEMTAALRGALGEPTTLIPGEQPEVRWVGDDATLRLTCLSSAVHLSLVTNARIALDDESAALNEQDWA
ncbi:MULTISPECIES: DUF6301 family protein [unclassified Nocardia]|uniref:DUF6301 family protein n=1 Tax=unclassified Nocardia TaxID=2637762 RepID=UPI001CE40409|nr:MULTISPECIES: DUF6301 family protein [unclassified Nocardia]